MSSIQTSRVQRESTLTARLLELPATASNFIKAEDIFLADKSQGYVDVLKDLLRGDAQQAVGRFNEVVSSAARMPACVNCGKATRTPPKSITAPASISRATLRYVTVFHLMWIPGLRLSEDTWTQNPVPTLVNIGKNKR